jgi:hypothetical protein
MGDAHPTTTHSALIKGQYVVNLQGRFKCRYSCGSVGWHGWGDPWPLYGTRAQLVVSAGHRIVGFRLGPGEGKLIALGQARRSNHRFAMFPIVPVTTGCATPATVSKGLVPVGTSWCTSAILSPKRPDYTGRWRIAFVLHWPIKHHALVSREWIVTVGSTGRILGTRSYSHALPPLN